MATTMGEDLEAGCLLELSDTTNLTAAVLSALCNGTATMDPLPTTPLSDELPSSSPLPMYRHIPPLWESDFPVALIYVVILAVALFIGTFGNITIILVSVTTTTMNKVGRDFVINLALADLCVNMVAEPMCILGVVKGEAWFSGRWLLCEIVAGMCITACFCAFLSLTTLTLNKYMYVCHNRLYQKVFKRSVCIVICVSCWVLATIFEFPNIVGWGDHYFDKKSHQCIWERTASFSYTMLVSIGFIASPLLLMSVCFCLIFLKIWRTKKAVFKLNHDDPLRTRRVWLESLRTSRTLVVVFFAFLICWTPYATINIVDFDDRFSLEVHLFATMLAHSHSSLNFTIYVICSASFRQAVGKLYKCNMLSWRIRNSLDTTTSRGTSEIPRGCSDTSDHLTGAQKKYYMNHSFQPTLGGIKGKQNGFTGIADEKCPGNGVECENPTVNGNPNSNGFEKY